MSDDPLRSQPWHKQLALGIERIGLISLIAPRVSALILVVLMVLAAFGSLRLKVDDSLSELFRSDTRNSSNMKRLRAASRRRNTTC